MDDQGSLGDIFDFTFTKFVTPSVVKILYILVIVMAGFMWLGMIFAGFANGVGGGFLGLIFGGLMFVIFILLYRVMFELVMVIFSIKRNTDRIS